MGVSAEMLEADLSIILVPSTIQVCMSLRLAVHTSYLNRPHPGATHRDPPQPSALPTSELRQPAARALASLLVRAGGVSFIYFYLRFAPWRLDTTYQS